MTETLNEKAETPRTPYWTEGRVDEIIKRLKSKYPADAEDTDEVSALLEYRRILRQQQSRDGSEDRVRTAIRRVREAITVQHEAICQFAVANGLSPTEITGCHQADGTVYRFWIERLDEKDPEKVAFLRQENERLQSVREWRPISTAPKDGTEVVLGWSSHSIRPTTGTWTPKGWLLPGGSVMASGDFLPTHWMPLAEPPTLKGHTND
jgi:hypothetical protein